MTYHFIITIQFDRGRRKRQIVHNYNGHVELPDGWSERHAFREIHAKACEMAGSEVDLSSVLFYRLVPDPERD